MGCVDAMYMGEGGIGVSVGHGKGKRWCQVVLRLIIKVPRERKSG